MTNETPTGTVMTLAEIKEMTGYASTITAYQILRRRGVHPVSYRKNPIQGGEIGEYDARQVTEALKTRISKYRSDLARAEADQT